MEVDGMHGSLEDMNKLAAVPDALYTRDGREVLITRWRPDFCMEDLPRVTIEGFVVMGEEGADDA